MSCNDFRCEIAEPSDEETFLTNTKTAYTYNCVKRVFKNKCKKAIRKAIKEGELGL